MLGPGGSAPTGWGVCSWGVCAWSGGSALGGACSGGVPAPVGCLVETSQDDYCCGQYASYWNAFLLHLSVILFTGGVHGRGCMAGGHAWQGDMCGGGHAWQGCMHGTGVCGRGTCMAAGMCGRRACVARLRGVCGREAMHGKGACMAGETANAVDRKHATGMHSCRLNFY